mmetsp:Transcript_1283/g.3366  ORF Transcript_1283/g.3366 Transcript_1283/m.3366 type:complete len:334 (-) Transcript_1283:86-1087(-)
MAVRYLARGLRAAVVLAVASMLAGIRGECARVVVVHGHHEGSHALAQAFLPHGWWFLNECLDSERWVDASARTRCVSAILGAGPVDPCSLEPASFTSKGRLCGPIFSSLLNGVNCPRGDAVIALMRLEVKSPLQHFEINYSGLLFVILVRTDLLRFALARSSAVARAESKMHPQFWRRRKVMVHVDPTKLVQEATQLTADWRDRVTLAKSLFEVLSAAGIQSPCRQILVSSYETFLDAPQHAKDRIMQRLGSIAPSARIQPAVLREVEQGGQFTIYSNSTRPRVALVKKVHNSNISSFVINAGEVHHAIAVAALPTFGEIAAQLKLNTECLAY